MGTRVLTIRREPSSLIYEGTRAENAKREQRKRQPMGTGSHAMIDPYSFMSSSFFALSALSAFLRFSLVCPSLEVS